MEPTKLASNANKVSVLPYFNSIKAVTCTLYPIGTKDWSEANRIHIIYETVSYYNPRKTYTDVTVIDIDFETNTTYMDIRKKGLGKRESWVTIKDNAVLEDETHWKDRSPHKVMVRHLFGKVKTEWKQRRWIQRNEVDTRAAMSA